MQRSVIRIRKNRTNELMPAVEEREIFRRYLDGLADHERTGMTIHERTGMTIPQGYHSVFETVDVVLPPLGVPISGRYGDIR
jgi:uncharacterized protein YdeI (YjbR/CyaY-like superfamily)